MAGGQRTRTPGELGFLVDMLAEVKERLRTLEQPSGEQLAQVVAELQTLVANIEQRLDDYIANEAYTKAQVDQQVANPPAGSAVTGNVTATGDITATGDLVAGDDLAVTGDATVGGTIVATGAATFNAGLRSSDVRGRVVTTDYVSVYVDGDGHLGYAPSSLRYKTNVAPATVDPVAVLSIEPKTFDYLGGDGRSQVGFIAEELHDAGLGDFVIYSEVDGHVVPDGVRYEAFAVAQQVVMRSLEARLRALEGND